MNTPITGVVPQPGETFPYSEFRGLRRFPSFVRCAIGEDQKDERYFIFCNIIE